MASMEKEFFWGCELNKDKKEYSWDCEDEELSQADIEQKLQLSQACLGSKAKTNEKNLVQVTTTDSSDNSVTFTILSLTSGKTDQCRISLGFPSSVTFKLIEGSGPVHLTGSVYQELYLLNDEGSDEDDEFVKSEEKVATKKRPLTSETPKGPPKKLARVEVEDEEESDDDDDDDDDDEEGESTEESAKMEVDVKPKQKKPEETPKTAKNKPESKDAKVKKKDEDEEEDEDSEEESDDEDEDESEEGESEEDESDEDDDDEDEEDDESDEEDEIATSLTAKKKHEGKGEQKKTITNGVVKVDKNKQEKPSKTPTQQPSTPKTNAKRDEAKKAGSKTPEPLDMDKLKERLLKTPNLPKKVEKFKNYMKNSYKVTDDSELTKLWDWLKANK